MPRAVRSRAVSPSHPTSRPTSPPAPEPAVSELIPLAPPARSQWPVHAHVMGTPMSRVNHMQNLCAQLMSRSLGNQLGASHVLGGGDAEVWKELGDIHAAVVHRLQQQQETWQQGLSGVWQEYMQLRQVNTLSKLVEQEYNVGMQLSALCISQAVNLTALFENIQIDMGYWLAQKQGAAA
jgi:hypothetical protein